MSIEDDWSEDLVDPATGEQASIYADGHFVIVGYDPDTSDTYVYYTDDIEEPWSRTYIGAYPLNFISVAYADGKWVAVSFDYRIYTGTSLTSSWIAATSSGAVSGDGFTNSLQCIAYGNGRWVAGGGSGRIITTTNPAGTWTAASSAGFNASDVVTSVAYGDGYWVACTLGGEVRYATDPTGTWYSAVTSSFTDDQVFWEVAYGGGKWMVVGSGSDGPLALWADPPSGAWSEADVGGSLDIGWYDYFRVVYDDGTWVIPIHSEQGEVRYATSPSGTWSSTYIPGALSTFGPVMFGDEIWVVGTDDNRLAYQGGGGHGWGLLL